VTQEFQPPRREQLTEMMSMRTSIWSRLSQ
jgi:hypothetical protein